MTAKTFEIRDKGTFVPVLAVRLRPNNDQDRFLLARAGYGGRPEGQAEYVMVWMMNGGSGQGLSDPFDWGQTRTMQVAHNHILTNFDRLSSGSVVDVEHILGETTEPKLSESLYGGLFPLEV